MPKGLTPKQERFIIAYWQGSTAADAYRQAYDAGNMLPASIHRNAHALLNNTKVTSRLTELKNSVAVKSAMTAAEYADWQRNLAAEAREAGDLTVASQAMERAAKAWGLLIDRQQVAMSIRDVPASDYRPAILTLRARAIATLAAPHNNGNTPSDLQVIDMVEQSGNDDLT